MTYYLAVDIGASSGRHILGWLEDGLIHTEEIYRFPNCMVTEDGHRCWDVEALLEHVIRGMERARELGKIPSYMGIDTWGVDYVLTDSEGMPIDKVYGYRDSRCEEGMRAVLAEVPFEELYRRTGIQCLPYNTVFQLMADRLHRPEALGRAERLLMIPDYLGMRLTGVAHQEYTNATTGALVSLESGEFDLELIERLGYPTRLFGRLSIPGDRLGDLSPEICERVGYTLTVLHPASHDTGSAVLAMPSVSEDAAYISSGTWSLLGAETARANTSAEACRSGFTHEGGYGKSYRFLTNIMGLWIIQSIRGELGGEYSFSELSDMAQSVPDGGTRINVNDDRLLAPESMLGALYEVVGRRLPLPELLSVVYHSMAQLYAESVKGLAGLMGRTPGALHIIGGGSRDRYLNSLTAKSLGIPVYAGPTEATAIGNILAQMLAVGVFGSVGDARRAVMRSFDVERV